MVDMCRTITKHAVLVKDPYRILFELQKAVAIARSGRPGPGWVDVPDDLQRMEIDPAKLIQYQPEGDPVPAIAPAVLDACIAALLEARRPVLVYGWGVHLAKAEDEARDLAQALDIPVAMTWAALDLLPQTDPLAIGGFGTHGVRHANFAVQNADLILAVGSRLDTKATGTPPKTFGRAAKIIMCDIDPTETGKFARLGLAFAPGGGSRGRKNIPPRLEGEGRPPAFSRSRRLEGTNRGLEATVCRLPARLRQGKDGQSLLAGAKAIRSPRGR